MSRDTILQCLEIATRPTTGEGEAQAALYQARRLMQKHSLDIQSMMGGDADEMDVLEDYASRLEAENAQLRHDLDKLKEKMIKKPSPRKVESGFCSFAQFKEAAIVHSGRSYGWQAAVSDATRDSKFVRYIHPSEIQRWRMEGQVPMVIYNALPDLTYAPRITRGMWSPDLYRYIYENRRAAPQDVSDGIFDAFRVRISPVAIKGALTRAKAGVKKHGSMDAWTKSLSCGSGR
jgi:hypothetical protein